MANPSPPPLNQAIDGTISHWNDEKGFGFIQYKAKSPGVFFHISSFAYHHSRPQKGNKVVFIAMEKNGRYSAQRVVLAKDADSINGDNIIDNTQLPPHLAEGFIFALISIFFYAALTYISAPLAIASLIISNLTYMLYSLDKQASLQHRQRIPEASLHIAAILGGWPGALIARALLRHKTKKIRFVIFFWLSIIINFAALYALVLFIPEHLDYFNHYIMSYLGF
ncbi:cold shock and DUF1294 domain-containing protein [Cardiobacteriaceae bacterium TAE3-ERU3]|nr:cold shock and DUF1294 domain-containing protein [Cardiobacteriaceae bacterium TAE3-ERU3]